MASWALNALSNESLCYRKGIKPLTCLQGELVETVRSPYQQRLGKVALTGIRAILDRVGKEPISGTVIRGEQESSHMGFSFSFDDAREQVRIARCYLQNGSGMNWVGDRLLSARAYAIDAWLAAHGHPATGSFGDSYIVFIEKSSNELADRVSELSAGWALLDYQLLGDPEGMIDTLPLQEWKILAAEYLDLADQLIAYLRSDGEDF